MKNLAPIHAVIPKGSLDSTSTATVMTATVPGVDALFNGVCVWLTNGVITSAANFTININGLGGKPVYSSQSAASRATTIFNVNYTALLIYNETRVSGGCWDYVYGYDSNTNTIGYQVRTNSLSLPMKSIVYRYRLLFTSADGKGFVPANNSTSTNATTARSITQEKIDPFGQIVYYGTTASVAAGSRPSASYLWQQYAFSIGYSFVVTLTEWKPVYLKCAPQSDGSAIIDSTTPFVQTLPSTEDGKIYIFLGVAYSSTNIELTLEHPVYCYKNGCIRQWTNAASDGAVSSVNGQTGAVSLGAADVGALPDSTTYVSSVNGSSGAVNVSVPTKTSDLTNDSGFITGMYIASYGSSTYAQVLAAYQANKVVYCRASSNTDPATGDQKRLAFLAYVSDPTTPTEFEFQYYRSVATHSDSQQGDQVFVYKLNSSTGWSVTTREAYTKIATGTGLSKSYSNGTLTLSYSGSTPPSAATADPLMDGTAAVGSSAKYAKEDHVHPSDTSKVSTTFNGESSMTYDSYTNTITNGHIANMKCESGTNEAFIQAYYDDAGSSPTIYIGSKAGNIYTASIYVDPSGIQIYGLVAPTRNDSAATKAYVDSAVSGVGGLPTVTSADNGKVLMVVNGAWAAASLPVYNGGVS